MSSLVLGVYFDLPIIPQIENEGWIIDD